MKYALFAMTLLSACANPVAAPNPNSVPNVLLSVTQARSEAGSIFVTGGIYDGAAAGQTARFVVTPDDRVICTFQTDPVLPGDGTEIVVTAHRLQLQGIHRRLSAAVLPNVVPLEIEYTTNFTVEHRTPSGLTVTTTGFGDPRFEAMAQFFQFNPTPCWLFG